MAFSLLTPQCGDPRSRCQDADLHRRRMDHGSAAGVRSNATPVVPQHPGGSARFVCPGQITQPGALVRQHAALVVHRRGHAQSGARCGGQHGCLRSTSAAANCMSVAATTLTRAACRRHVTCTSTPRGATTSVAAQAGSINPCTDRIAPRLGPRARAGGRRRTQARISAPSGADSQRRPPCHGVPAQAWPKRSSATGSSTRRL